MNDSFGHLGSLIDEQSFDPESGTDRVPAKVADNGGTLFLNGQSTSNLKKVSTKSFFDCSDGRITRVSF
jgi:hypothetical protein